MTDTTEARAARVALTVLALMALAGCGDQTPTEMACKLPSGEIVRGPSVFELRDSEGFAVSHSYDFRCQRKQMENER